MLLRPADCPLSDRIRLRVEVPERILRMAHFGLRHVESDDSGWWRRVEREMESFVYRHLPASASDVRLELDPDLCEVVVEYALSAP